MKFPRFFLNLQARTLWQLLKAERRANGRLRRELLEWQQKVLEQARVSPLFQPKAKPVEQAERPPIGQSAKRAYLATRGPSATPSAEEILAMAEKAKNGNQ